MESEIVELMENDDLVGFKAYTQKNTSWRGIVFYDERFTMLHLAVCHNKPQFVKWILEAGFDCNCKTKSGDTPLHLAVEAGAGDSLKVLLEGKPNCEIADELEGVTPLLKAIRSGQLPCAQMIILSGASLSCKDHENNTPLLLAIDLQHTSLVDLLLERDADFEMNNADGYTAMHMACKRADRVRSGSEN